MQTTNPQPTDQFIHTLADSLRQGNFVRLVLSQPAQAESGPIRILARWVELKAGPHLSLCHKYTTRDLTENLPINQAPDWLRQQLAHFSSALLGTTQRDWQWKRQENGQVRLVAHVPTSSAIPSRRHDRVKRRLLDETAHDWLRGLGIVNETGGLRAEKADKYRQIERYLEIFSHLAEQCGWLVTPGAQRNAPSNLVLADMGCGKAYLTFALWHYLHRAHQIQARIIGVESRSELVAANQELAQRIGAQGLEFIQGDIATTPLPPLDALIALHACNTATDDALRRGVELAARLIVVAPCCYQALRPQLRHPEALAPVLKHGLMEERLAEWVTDGLRTLCLEGAGYQTKVIEFVGSEHTPKNLMIAAVRHGAPGSPGSLRDLDQLKAMFGLP